LIDWRVVPFRAVRARHGPGREGQWRDVRNREHGQLAEHGVAWQHVSHGYDARTPNLDEHLYAVVVRCFDVLIGVL
jgi:hypothetical protein